MSNRGEPCVGYNYTSSSYGSSTSNYSGGKDDDDDVSARLGKGALPGRYDDFGTRISGCPNKKSKTTERELLMM
jgi:hypothetical protein